MVSRTHDESDAGHGGKAGAFATASSACSMPGAPAATLNKNLKKIFGEKPVLYLLNKSDLADEGADGFVRLAEEKGRQCIRCNSTELSSRRAIMQKLTRMTEEKRERAEAKG